MKPDLQMLICLRELLLSTADDLKSVYKLCVLLNEK
jgi:hypothetical protein